MILRCIAECVGAVESACNVDNVPQIMQDCYRACTVFDVRKNLNDFDGYKIANSFLVKFGCERYVPVPQPRPEAVKKDMPWGALVLIGTLGIAWWMLPAKGVASVAAVMIAGVLK